VAFLYSHAPATKSAAGPGEGDTITSANGQSKRKFAELENDAA